MTDLPLLYQSITSVAQQIRRGELTSVEATQACLDRIDEIDSLVGAFTTVTAELALRQAAQADLELGRGQDRGALHGIPMAYKDLIATREVLTTANSRLMEDWIPGRDSDVVQRLSHAGVVMLGKLACDELGFGVQARDDPIVASPRNPWNLNHSTGGSSSGSAAALAAGLCFGSLGTDTGGSIRGPAAYCGVAGFKPTFGLVSRLGIVPFSWSLDHVGPLARTAKDCAHIFQALTVPDQEDPWPGPAGRVRDTSSLSQGVAGRRLGIPRAWLRSEQGLSDEVLTAFDGALEVLSSLGGQAIEIDSEPFMGAREVCTVISLSEAYWYYESLLQSSPESFGVAVREGLKEAEQFTATDYMQARSACASLTQAIDSLTHSIDAVVLPSMPTTAPSLNAARSFEAREPPSFLAVFNLTGRPAVTVPCGFSSEGLPIGIQFAGHCFQDGSILRLAESYQAATDWAGHSPKL